LSGGRAASAERSAVFRFMEEQSAGSI